MLTLMDTADCAGEKGNASGMNARRMQLFTRLTPAERELVPLLAKGLFDKGIDTAFGKSVPTVKNQLRFICKNCAY